MIVLIGYMGAGKTTLGKALAKHLNGEFCDLDWYIEQTTQQTIPQIFASKGEAGFRQIESAMLKQVLQKQFDVVAVGGGTPCFGNNMELMNQSAYTIYLKATPETLKCHIRMGGSIRPLIEGKDDNELITFITQALKTREPFYSKAKHTVAIDTITTEEQIQLYVGQLAQIAKEKGEKLPMVSVNKGEISDTSETSDDSPAASGRRQLTIIKVGGKIVETPSSLSQLIRDFSSISGYKLLVHGGGRSATQLATQLGIETQMVNGRRITDADMLRVVTMVYAGLVNKNIVAQLQAHGVNALGLTGTDMNIIRSHRRAPNPIDFGFVGDVDAVDADRLSSLIDSGISPVLAPLTHDGCGTLLNTNADTIAGEVAKAMVGHYDVTLVYCFEKAGVLLDEDDDKSVITHITPPYFKQLVDNGTIQGGMIPKLQNAFDALAAGVKKVVITKADAILGTNGTIISQE